MDRPPPVSAHRRIPTGHLRLDFDMDDIQAVCSYCGRRELRRSRFRLSDVWFLFLLKYPSRCRFCRERQHFPLRIALKLPEAMHFQKSHLARR
jgi:hypothetical protein